MASARRIPVFMDRPGFEAVLRATFIKVPTRRRRLAAAFCCLAWPVAAFAAGTSLDSDPSSWTFRVLLDGQPIGEHRFTATPSDDRSGHTVLSEATFTVRLLGITLYRYQHRSVEHWRGDCLVGLSADTDDNGQRMRVSAASQGEVFEVSAPAPLKLRGCVMSFAYWSPALRSQHQLLNGQTGRLESVRLEPVAEGSVALGGRPAGATGWRIDGMPQPIFLWYTPQGDWLGLDTRVDGGRVLSYRLP
jgi:hypothetical protein